MKQKLVQILASVEPVVQAYLLFAARLFQSVPVFADVSGFINIYHRSKIIQPSVSIISMFNTKLRHVIYSCPSCSIGGHYYHFCGVKISDLILGYCCSCPDDYGDNIERTERNPLYGLYYII